jgi:small conductance mechanosensitive channel
MQVLSTLEEVCGIINETYKDCLWKSPSGEVKSPFKVYGVTDIEDNPVGVRYTVTGVVESYKYFTVLKETKLQILIVFKKNNIHIAYPTHINILHYDNNDQKEL